MICAAFKLMIGQSTKERKEKKKQKQQECKKEMIMDHMCSI